MKSYRFFMLLLVLCIVVCCGCDSEKPSDSTAEEKEVSKSLLHPAGTTLKTRIQTPDGYTRTKIGKNTLTAFLRNYSLKKDGSPVLLYNGSKKGNQSDHIAVFKLPLENENLQQCADSVMRVYAEYYWNTKQFEKISFHLSDGFLADYAKWREGYRIQVSDTDTYWTKSTSYDDSYECFQKYLRFVFAYAGTASMESESTKIDLKDAAVGDVFLKGGSPGHVVMIVDMCENENGKKAFLLAQGFMPAQEFHILKNESHTDDPWYYEAEIQYPFETPGYTFPKNSLKHLSY
ncbi:MAG: DUF4846 domain-containing protein [Candidatus Fimousia sp.]